jgi:hypothetical protein
VRLEVRSVFTIAILTTTISAFAAQISDQSPERIASRAASGPALLQAIIHPVLRASGQIFSGTVLQIEHRNSNSSSSLATTTIFFRVDEAIRNVTRGQVVEVHEWAGLWQSGERYHPGERVLLFLYPPSKLGLTSPVGNRAGRFPVDGIGRVIVRGPIGRPAHPIEIRRVVAAIRQAGKE